MKRITLTAVLLLSAITVLTAKPLKVTKGDLSVLKEDATATWTIDLSDAVFEKAGDFKEWCEDEYETRVKLMDEAFFASFNDNSQGLKLVNEGEAPYKLIFKVKKFERKQGPGLWGSCYIRVFGTLSIINTETEETALELEVDGVKGDTDFVDTDRFPKTMDWLARDIFKLKK